MFYNAYHQIAETNLTSVIRQTLQKQGSSVQTAFEDLSAGQAVEGYVTQLRTAQQTASMVYFDPLGAMLFTSTGTTTMLSTASSETDYNVYIIPPAELPDNIKTYVSQTYNGSTILKSAVSVTNSMKLYLVYGSVSGGAFELNFNEAGAVTKTMVYLPASSGQSGTISGQDGTLTQANLPASVVTWLNQNYPNWTFQKAARNTTSINLNILVDKTIYSLVFDLDWNFTAARSIGSPTSTPPTSGSPNKPSTSVPVKESDLPATVKEFLNQTYPGWAFREGNKTGDQITIIIEANGRYSLSFDSDGKLLKTVKIS